MIARFVNTTTLRRLTHPLVYSVPAAPSVRSLSSGVPVKDAVVLNKVEGSLAQLKDAKLEKESVKIEACGDVNDDEDDDEMEKEQMFVEPHESFEFRIKEWGGPRRGGRLPEPTRYGDWERKGRATDF